MNIVAIIQARMTSTRLPGKVLMEVLGKPMIGYQLERTQRCRSFKTIVVATTTNRTDDALADYVASLGFGVYRGSEMDVLARYAGAAAAFSADVVVRMTADCPVIDPAVTDLVVQRFLAHDPPLDYATNGIPRSYPTGLDTEVVSRAALAAAAAEAESSYDREHVFPFIYKQPHRFRMLSVVCQPDLSQHRWTLDEPEDFTLLSRIIEDLYPDRPDFDYRDVLALIAAQPALREINLAVMDTPRRWERQVFDGALQAPPDEEESPQ